MNLVAPQVSEAADLAGIASRHGQHRLHPRHRIYELTDIPVHFLCPAGFPWRPRFADEQAGKISLRLLGPAGEEAPLVQAYLDLTRGTYGRGRNVEPVRLQLPRDFQLAQDAPPRIAFLLDPPTE